MMCTTRSKVKVNNMKTEEKLYMNVNTGSVDTYENWYYTNSLGEGTTNAVDIGEVIEVIRKTDGGWSAVS